MSTNSSDPSPTNHLLAPDAGVVHLWIEGKEDLVIRPCAAPPSGPAADDGRDVGEINVWIEDPPTAAKPG